MLVILITLDCLRKDHFNEVFTPRFIKNADEWVSFENSFSQSQNTLSSHFTMLTSNYLFQHGIYSNFKGKKLPGHSMDKHLKKAGFEAKAFCGVSFLSNLLGNQIGEADPYFVYQGPKIVKAIKRRLGGERRSAESVMNAGLKWLLNKNRKKDAFLWLHFFDAHMAYTAPDSYMKKFVKKERTATTAKEQFEEKGWFSPYFKDYEKKVPLAYFPNCYGAAVNYIDEVLANFFGLLKQLNYYDSSLIFVTADHGECLKGDHDIYCAHKKLFDETIHVPFFVKFPEGGPRSEKVDEITAHLDIAPTILGFASREEEKYEGLDLRSLLKGKTSSRDFIFSEHVDNYMRSVRSRDGIYVEITEGAENKWGMKVEKERLFKRDGAPWRDEAMEPTYKKEMDRVLEKRASVQKEDDDAEAGSKEIEDQLHSLGYL